MTSILCELENSIIVSTEIPESLRIVIAQIQAYSYEELYETKDTQNVSLEDALNKTFDAIEAEKNSLDISHFYFCIAIVIGLAVQPTIKAYLPRETITSKIFQDLFQNWIYPQNYFESNLNVSFQNYLGKYQSLDEAIDVFDNMLQVLEAVKTREAVLNILDDCLQGYAIFPGSQGRREIFDWLLLDVVPSVFCGRLPENIYTLHGIHKMNKYVSKIRQYFWKVVRNNQKQGNIDFHKQNLLLIFLAR